MSWNGESRAIKEALQNESRVTRAACAICGRNMATVHSKSAKYQTVTMLCYRCANEFLEQDQRAEGKVSGETPGDRLYELLYCDNKDTPNYRSAKIPQNGDYRSKESQPALFDDNAGAVIR